MIFSVKTKLLSCKILPDKSYNLLLSDTQVSELLKKLKDFTVENDLQMIQLRTKFFNEEGYMESDEVIKKYYEDK